MTITGKTRVAGVIGWPVGHSRSPQLHGFWLAAHGIDGAYVPLPVRPEDLATAVRALPALGLRGVNVTVPHKQAAHELVDRVDESAARVGAVNTIVVEADGTLVGSNTDGYGFIENIRSTVPDWTADAGPAVLVGAGGAARAVAAALLAAGVPQLTLVNRTPENAERLAEQLGGTGGMGNIAIVAWAERHAALAGAGLLVNATSLGMEGQPALELDLGALPAGAVVNDLVYAPLETGLLAAARERGCVTVDGLGMLLHQARPAFAAWFGVDPEVTPELRAHVLRPDTGLQ